MSKFKVGDRVRTIKCTALLPLGIETKIENVVEWGNNEFEYLVNFKDEKYGEEWTLSYGEQYFELIEDDCPSKETPYVYLYGKQNKSIITKLREKLFGK